MNRIQSEMEGSHEASRTFHLKLIDGFFRFKEHPIDHITACRSTTFSFAINSLALIIHLFHSLFFQKQFTRVRRPIKRKEISKQTEHN